MAKSTAFDELRLAASKGTTERSTRWYRDKIRELGLNRVNTSSVFDSNLGKIVGQIIPGNMFLYYYDPKTKEKLPFYDIFPLVLPFRSLPDGFLGLNLHYLPPLARVSLLSQLMDYRNNTNMDASTKLKLSWKLLENSAMQPIAHICVKRYLYSHVGSGFMKIDAEDWKTAVLLPLESFQKASSHQVWSHSKRSM